MVKRYGLLCILLLVFFYSDLFAQKKLKDFEIPELKKSDLGDKAFKDYPGSTLRIIYDHGLLTFIPEGDAFRIEFSRSLRIKFLNDTVISAHNLGLSSFEKDELLSLYHYQLENGSIAKNDISSRWQMVNLYRPLSSELEAIHSGDILDFEFKTVIESPKDIPSWQFEYELPVDYSEWYAEIPGMFVYKPIFKGYVPFDVNTNELLKDEKNRWVEMDGFYIYQNRYVCSKIAPFKKVVYSPASKNYLSSVDFYLEQIKAYKSYKAVNGQSWEQVSGSLYKDEKLKARIDHFSNAGLLESFYLDSNQGRSVGIIYDWVVSNIRWNGEIGIYAEHSLDTVLNNKEGSIAEINLLLCALLTEAGINTSPVILRTIDQGEVNMELPNSSQFNYLIALVDIRGILILLDASDECLDFNLLRPICLNNKGLKISPRFEEWIDLETEDKIAKMKIVTQCSVQDSKLMASVSVSKLNYFAFEDCKNFTDINELIRIESGVAVNDVKLELRDSVLSGNRILFTADLDSYAQKSGSSWSFNPFFVERIQDSPFEEKERKYPIIFPYLFEYNWNFVFNFSDNIEILDFPKSQEISSPQKTIRFIYKVTPLDGILQINAQLSILQRRFEASTYEDILDFYEELYKKFNQEIKIKVKS